MFTRNMESGNLSQSNQGKLAGSEKRNVSLKRLVKRDPNSYRVQHAYLLKRKAMDNLKG